MSSEHNKIQELIELLKNPPTALRPFKREGLDRVVFFAAGIFAVAFVVWGFVSPVSLGNVAGTLLTGVMDNFGRIPLGRDDVRHGHGHRTRVLRSRRTPVLLYVPSSEHRRRLHC